VLVYCPLTSSPCVQDVEHKLTEKVEVLVYCPLTSSTYVQDVEHELTEKVEVLVYCPLTIRQRLLYKGLRQNIRMEEILAGNPS